MNEPLLLIERVKNTILLGESHFREFKSAKEGKPGDKQLRNPTKICKEIGEALVAFTNADGGDLLIGVEDSGEITGLKHTEEQIETMLNAPYTHVYNDQKLPLLYRTKINLEETIILFFSVSKSDGQIYQLPDGRCVRRKDKETIPIDFNTIIIERSEQRSREFDREFLDGANVSDLDLELLSELSRNYLPGISIEKYLQQIGIGEYTPAGLRLRRAAIILFSKKIENWIPRCELRVIKVNGNELLSGADYNVTVDERYVGNAFRLLTNGWDFLRPFLIGKTEFGPDATFQSQYIYPEIACREALVNAIAHRDYTISNSIDFIIYSDRLTIKSPGLLLSSIKIEDLLLFRNVHESRNTYVAKVLRENKFMREMGEGIKRIYEILNDNEIGNPILESKENSFHLTIENKSIYSNKELEWLSLFESYRLNKLQKRIVALGLHDKEISPNDIYKALSTNDRDTYDSVVTSLRVLGLLDETRTSSAATAMSKRQKIKKQRVGRYKVVSPGRQQILNQTKVLNAIFVFNLPSDIGEERLKEIFNRYGSISNIRQPINRYNKRPYNYCFVHFAEDSSAQELIRKKTIDIDGHIATISEYIENMKQKSNKSLNLKKRG
ncbi:MAG: ATP-binding protein [Coriobacteriia bacterium]|nr:ATP-binding protein [Coriobacteriia bacterium]